jgi:hypothetical protein
MKLLNTINENNTENVVPYSATVARRFHLWFNYAGCLRNKILTLVPVDVVFENYQLINFKI